MTNDHDHTPYDMTARESPMRRCQRKCAMRHVNFVAGFMVLATLHLGGLTPRVFASNTAQFGYYWQDGTLPYDTRFTYQYDVAVYLEGIWPDNSTHWFTYVTAENKHVSTPTTTYGVEVVQQYGYNTDNAGSLKRLWFAGVRDTTRYSHIFVSSDAATADTFDLSTLQAEGYFLLAPALLTLQYPICRPAMQGAGYLTLDWELGRSFLLNFLRVRQETSFVRQTGDGSSSTWRNRILLYNFAAKRWDLKASNQFTVPASRQTVRDETAAAGSGIWAGILETDAAEAPPVKAIVYQNRKVTIIDHKVTSTPPLNATNTRWITPSSYRVFSGSTISYEGYSAGTDMTSHVVATLTNGDDSQSVSVNGAQMGAVAYSQELVVDLGDLYPSDRIDFATYNDGGGYTWGYDLNVGGASVFHDEAGTVGMQGANGNDQTHQNQVVHTATLNGVGALLDTFTATQCGMP